MAAGPSRPILNAFKSGSIATVSSSSVPRTAASAAVEDPGVVLIVPGSPEVFHGSKTPAAVEQFVAERNIHFTVGILNEPAGDQRFLFPMQARHDRCVLGGRADFASIRQQLILDLPRAAVADKLGLVF